MLNYAEQWSSEILKAIVQGTLCSPFITNNVKWLSAKTFHFTLMTTSGYKAHSRSGGWNRGTVTQTDVPYTLYHDRDVEFLVDNIDVDETNKTASIQRISEKFIELQANPEMDAEFFDAIYAIALAADLYSETPISSWTAANVFSRLKAMLKTGNLRTYKQRGTLLGYVSTEIMDLLERSTEFTRQIVMNTIADSGLGINTRVTDIDGVVLFEVIDTERFYTNFDFADGFVPAAGSHKLNVVFASTETVKKVPKISSIYFFEPGQHTEGDGYLYQNRAFGGTFVFPNGKNGEIDSVFVDVDNGAPLTVQSVAGSTTGKSLITLVETPFAGNSLKYKTGAALTLPAYGSVLGGGYVTFVSETDYTATTGQDFAVVEVSPLGEVVRSGKVVVVSKA